MAIRHSDPTLTCARDRRDRRGLHQQVPDLACQHDQVTRFGNEHIDVRRPCPFANIADHGGNDRFNSLDLRLSRAFRWGRLRLDGLVEMFNVFNVTNILGTSTVNYSGFANGLVRDSNDPSNSGYLRSSAFGMPVSTAGGFFGSGGPFALQFGGRVSF